MPMIIGGLAAYLSSRPNTIPAITGANLYENSPDAVEAQIVPTVAALCIIVAITYCRRAGRPLNRPSPHLSFAANFFHMINLSLSDQQLLRLEQLWLLYADHGLSNATANFLQTASTRADPVTCLIAALSAGSGPLHGGAIDMIYHMLEGVGDKANVPTLLNDVKQGKTRLYGFGHRIYNTLDPRAPLVKEILASFDLTKYPIIGVANEIERLASRDEWFQARQVEMNVDLYSGFPYIALLVILLFSFRSCLLVFLRGS
jgi:citrate synthase